MPTDQKKLLKVEILKRNMKLGKFSIYILIYFFLILDQSFGETKPDIEIYGLDTLPSTYEEEEFLEEDDTNQEMLQQVKYKELKKSIGGIVSVEIKALDKITAKTSTLSIKLGEEKFFGNLKIKPLKCEASEIDQSPDTVAYLQVIDTSDKTNDQVFVFNGWTFASSPTLKSLDHAIYDLWLLGCSNT